MSRRVLVVLAVLILGACSSPTAPHVSAAGVWMGHVFFGDSLPLTLTLVENDSTSTPVISGFGVLNAGALDSAFLGVRGTRTGSGLNIQVFGGGGGGVITGTISGPSFRGTMSNQTLIFGFGVDSVALVRVP